MKQKLPLTLAILLTIALLTACGQSTEPTPSTSPEPHTSAEPTNTSVEPTSEPDPETTEATTTTTAPTTTLATSLPTEPLPTPTETSPPQSLTAQQRADAWISQHMQDCGCSRAFKPWYDEYHLTCGAIEPVWGLFTSEWGVQGLTDWNPGDSTVVTFPRIMWHSRTIIIDGDTFVATRYWERDGTYTTSREPWGGALDDINDIYDDIFGLLPW